MTLNSSYAISCGSPTAVCRLLTCTSAKQQGSPHRGTPSEVLGSEASSSFNASGSAQVFHSAAPLRIAVQS